MLSPEQLAKVFDTCKTLRAGVWPRPESDFGLGILSC